MNTKFDLTEKFVLTEKANPGWSSIICFLHVANRINVPLDILEASFDDLVDKKEYNRGNRQGLIDYAASIMKKKA